MRKGFTLIELLVVIAIIAILAAILFPVFARARAKAQQANCLSNVKQLSLGVLMYASDYDSRFPFAWRSEGEREHWHGSIYPYIKNLQIYACPSTNTSPVLQGPPNPWGGNSPWVVTNYRFNPCLGAVGGGQGCYVWEGDTGNPCARGGAGPAIPLTQEAVYRPAEIAMIYESLPEDGGSNYATNPDRAINCNLAGDPYDITWGGNGYDPWYFGTRVAQRHNEGSNIGYTDGHVKWISRNVSYTTDVRGGWSNVP